VNASGFAVELREVTKRFGETLALDHVTLQVREGEFFSMLGPSGCGKTTSLRLIAGFEIPSEGEVWIGGEEQGRRPAYQRPVNTVFQNYALFPHMTVLENTAFGLEMKHVPRSEIVERVRQALDMVQLPGKEDRRPRQLSGGQQQRVALARALVNRPKVLLLDEPLGALDLKLRKAMQLELKALQERVGITFVYVTHDQEEALTMSDRIAVMNLGHVLQVGAPEEIYERPASRFVADFIGETNFLEGQVAAVEGELATVAADGLMMKSTFDGRPSVGRKVTVAVRPEKIRLSRRPLDGPNAFEGRIERMTYVGKDSDYRVQIGRAILVRVRVQNEAAGGSDAPAPGDVAWVQWPPSCARLFQE
jgi:spermidine/putrescine transport system ATP-binding protein